MSNVNRIFIIGRLTSDPELRVVGQGSQLCKFTLAVDRPNRNTGSQNADFIPVVAWANLAEICGKYLKKGRLAYVGGRIQTRKYQTTEGENRYVTEVVASEMTMLDKAPSGSMSNSLESIDLQGTVEHGGEAGFSNQDLEPVLETVGVEDDLPF